MTPEAGAVSLCVCGRMWFAKGIRRKMIEKFISMKELYIGMCEQSLLPEYLKERFFSLIEERTKILQG